MKLQINNYQIAQNYYNIDQNISDSFNIKKDGKKKHFSVRDPILNNNFKYDKRKKQRQADKQKQKQHQMLQEQKRKQLKDIQRQVDQEIKLKKATLMNKLKKNPDQFVKQSMISQIIVKKAVSKENHKKQAKKTKKIKKKTNANIKSKQSDNKQTNTNNVNIVTDLLTKCEIQSVFYKHFSKQIPMGILKREQINKRVNQVGQQVKKQLRNLFGVATQDKQDERRIIQAQKMQKEQQNPYNLINQQKVQQKILIDGHSMKVTKAFFQNREQLKNVDLNSKQQRQGNLRIIQENTGIKNTDLQLNQVSIIMKKMVNNYSDCQFIQNKQQTTIQSFRKQVLNHILNHLKLCNLLGTLKLEFYIKVELIFREKIKALINAKL